LIAVVWMSAVSEVSFPPSAIAPTNLADRPVSRVDGERDAILFSGLAAPDPGRALRELGSAVVVDLNDFPVLRNVGFEPSELRAKKGVDVGRVTAVLVGRGEEVFDPDDAEGGLFLLAELCVAGEHLTLREGIGDRVPLSRLTLFRLLFRPDGGLFGERRAGDRAEVSLLRHVAVAHVLEHRGKEGAKEPELADLSERHGEGCRDRFLRPVFRGEIFNCSPEIDWRHRRAHDVFGDGAHVVERIGRLTRIAISVSLLATALLMRRRPAMMVRVPSSCSEKSGG